MKRNQINIVAVQGTAKKNYETPQPINSMIEKFMEDFPELSMFTTDNGALEYERSPIGVILRAKITDSGVRSILDDFTFWLNKEMTRQ